MWLNNISTGFSLPESEPLHKFVHDVPQVATEENCRELDQIDIFLRCLTLAAVITVTSKIQDSSRVMIHKEPNECTVFKL